MPATPHHQFFEDLWTDEPSSTHAEDAAEGAEAASFTQSEIDAAYRAGLAEGEARAGQSLAAQSLTLLKAINSAIGTELAGYAAYKDDLSRTITARARRFCEDYALTDFARSEKARLEKALAIVTAHAAPHPRPVIRVSPAHYAQLTDAHDTINSLFDLEADDTMENDAFSIVWADGHLTQSRSRYEKDIAHTLNALFATDTEPPQPAASAAASANASPTASPTGTTTGETDE